ncbi:phosphatidylserine decarboxylase [Flavobacteriaceae bacterium 3-367]|uniref:phosphatidylserine decarboxylase n=1 Tax=Eudoraea algarum TaxID=3417568 RepID=UPI00328ED78E
MKSTLSVKFMMAFFMGCLMTVHLCAQQDASPVQELKKLYGTDAKFKNTADAMFENVHPLADGSPNPWKNKGIEDLYSFLNDWFFFLPNTQDGLDRILEFSFLYYKNPAGMKFILEEPGRSWSLKFIEERGKYMDSPASTTNIEQWLSDTELPNDDFVLPIGGFKSFNEFFIRDLKPGKRPITSVDDNSILVSPADGVINMINNDIRIDDEIPTKGGMTLSLTKLLDASTYSERFVGGTALAVFLLPTNYHHFHAPISGKIIESKQDVGDRLFGMPDILDIINEGNIAYNKDYSVFQDFRHGYYIFETEDYGLIAMVPIGLQTIGSVVFEEKFKNIKANSPVEVYKGDKLGHFAYGGSTVLLLFEKNRLKAVSVSLGQKIGDLKK